jgi:hypothetical protein
MMHQDQQLIKQADSKNATQDFSQYNGVLVMFKACSQKEEEELLPTQGSWLMRVSQGFNQQYPVAISYRRSPEKNDIVTMPRSVKDLNECISAGSVIYKNSQHEEQRFELHASQLVIPTEGQRAGTRLVIFNGKLEIEGILNGHLGGIWKNADKVFYTMNHYETPAVLIAPLEKMDMKISKYPQYASVMKSEGQEGPLVHYCVSYQSEYFRGVKAIYFFTEIQDAHIINNDLYEFLMTLEDVKDRNAVKEELKPSPKCALMYLDVELPRTDLILKDAVIFSTDSSPNAAAFITASEICKTLSRPGIFLPGKWTIIVGTTKEGMLINQDGTIQYSAAQLADMLMQHKNVRENSLNVLLYASHAGQIFSHLQVSLAEELTYELVEKYHIPCRVLACEDTVDGLLNGDLYFMDRDKNILEYTGTPISNGKANVELRHLKGFYPAISRLKDLIPPDNLKMPVVESMPVIQSSSAAYSGVRDHGVFAEKKNNNVVTRMPKLVASDSVDYERMANGNKKN